MKNNMLSTKKIVTLALFVAISYILSFFSFPIFPAAPYLKLDFGNVFILLPSLLFGPFEGIAICLVKELLSLINSTTGGVGEIANFIMTSSYILIPSIIYKYKKGIVSVLISLLCACVVGTSVATLTNRFIVFPLYMGSAAPKVFASVFVFVVLFNLIKTASISILSFVLYKRLSSFFKKIAVKKK